MNFSNPLLATSSLQQQLLRLRPKLVGIAQAIYDHALKQKQEGRSGGLCEAFAQAFRKEIRKSHPEWQARSRLIQVVDDGIEFGHSILVVLDPATKQRCVVDIPPNRYEYLEDESGWTVHDNVRFRPADITVREI